MRDLETISTAVTAAETGHLVLSTLHTIGASATIDRIIDVFPPHQQQQIRVQLSMVLESVISQQLIPTTQGGRVAAFEVLHANPAIRNLIREGKTFQITSQLQTNKKIGMQTMDDSIYDLYAKGIINKKYAVEFAVDSAAMERKVGVC
jgi:twitching motility protein PilT